MGKRFFCGEIYMTDRDLGFHFICKKSRVKEARRELGKIVGVELFYESSAIRNRDAEGNLGPVEGQRLGGTYRTLSGLEKVQFEIQRRSLGDQLETLLIKDRFDSKREYRRWLAAI